MRFNLLFATLLVLTLTYSAYSQSTVVNGNRTYSGLSDFHQGSVKLPSVTTDQTGACPLSGVIVENVNDGLLFTCVANVWTTASVPFSTFTKSPTNAVTFQYNTSGSSTTSNPTFSYVGPTASTTDSCIALYPYSGTASHYSPSRLCGQVASDGSTGGFALYSYANTNGIGNEFSPQLTATIERTGIEAPRRIVKYSVSVVANGTSGCANVGGLCWLVKNAFTNASTLSNVTTTNTQAVTLFTAPANYIITGNSLKANTACSGTSITDVNVSLGTSAVSDLFAPAYSLFAAPSSSNVQDTLSYARGTAASEAINARFTSTGNTLDQIAAGCAVDIWIQQDSLQ